VAGDSFQVFNPGSHALGFTNVTPVMAGSGLVWNTNSLASAGTIEVMAASAPRISSFGVSGGQLTMSGTGGVPTANYYVLASTNAGLPLGQWSYVATNAFDGSGNFHFVSSLTPGAQQCFYLIRLP
jgi:hypothetical protein